MRRRFAVLLAVIATLVSGMAPALADGAERDTATVSWHAQQAGMGNTGVVPGAEAQLVRTDNGISYRLSTNGLTPGNAYTLWLVVINNPGFCAGSVCTAPEIFNIASNSQVRYAAGNVAGVSGNGTFAGHISEGALSGWLPDRGLADARFAEIHLVINDHGPALAEFMPGMIKTYRGGCSDSSPFPGIFPATAMADGEEGPNTCRLFQAATFRP